MAYCDEADIILAFPEAKIEELVIDDVSTEVLADTAPQARLAEAIAKADGMIDAALAPHYDTPVADPAPVEVRRLSVELAFAFLTMRRTGSWDDDDRDRWDRLTEELDAIRAGRVSVPGLTRTGGVATADVTRHNDAWDRQSEHNALTDYPYKEF